MSAGEARRRGRPRDENVERRIVEAAIAIYADVGWAGFNIDAVARVARVGKASIYLRWPNRESLLGDALASELRFIEDADSGNLRSDLTHIAIQLAELYAGDRARAYLRAILDSLAEVPGLEAYRDHIQSQMHVARVIVRRGQERNELPKGTSVTMVLDALGGGLLVHAITSPQIHGQSAKKRHEHAKALVELLLASSDTGLTGGKIAKIG